MYYVATMNGDNTQSFFAYETMPQAVAAYHTEMAYANANNITKTCVVMDNHGAVYRSEEYIAAAEE